MRFGDGMGEFEIKREDDFRAINKVAILSADDYDNEKMYLLMKEQLKLLGFDAYAFAGKTVMLKPNLLLKFAPERAATVHPSLVYAIGRVFVEAGARVILAESPGGPYTAGILRGIYKTSGMQDASESAGFELNFDTSEFSVICEQGERSKHFNFIKPLQNADLVVNLCKLKSHSMATMTAGVKNLFGTIPGTQKVEFHSRFPKHKDFASALVDLTSCICSNVPVLTFCDAVIGMEGNGPSAGEPRKIGCIIASENPFALDLLCAHIIGAGNTVPMLENAKSRGMMPRTVSGLEVVGDSPERFVIRDFKFPDTHKKSKIDYLPRFLSPHPKVNKNLCIGCGECARSCPQKVITIVGHKAHISLKSCIRCYCCQELCKPAAIKIHRSWVYRLVR